MNLVLTRGCIANNLEYGDNSLYDMDNIEQYEMLMKLIDKVISMHSIAGVIENIVESYSEAYSFDDHPCEQCGYTVCTYEIEI